MTSADERPHPDRAPGEGCGPADSDLDELLVELIVLEDGGESGTEALERLCSEHPDHATVLRKRYALLCDMGMTGEGARDSLAQGPEVPERLDEFEILEPLGQGGMGVVYRARQESLGREVALKLVRPEQLWFDGARQRFRREVTTVARLSHPGIVPVHAVGEAGGLPYFAMELVRGVTLAQALQRLANRSPRTLTGSDLAAAVSDASGREARGAGDAAPEVPELFRGSWVEVCLRIVRAIAEALEHAHRSGVLHRDIKPSNVMLTPEGRVMLLDFGLSSEEQGGRETRTGSQAGSLAYMAPELLAAEAKPSRKSDVYGLGVTLYELLTLQLPFAAGSAPALRAAIVAARTSEVRSCNPLVSWEAETVCQAAMERAPERRYATAADLALDLSNVLERRPIVARRPGPALRVRRFLERHPVATVGAVVLMVSAPLTWALQERRASTRLAETNAELQLALAQADANFHTAVRAVDELLTNVGESALANQPGMGSVRRELLEQAAAFYESFLDEYSGKDALAREVARAWFRTAIVRRDLGDFEASHDAFQRQHEVLTRLLEREPEDPDLLAMRAHGELQLGEVLHRMQRYDEARVVLERALDVVRGLRERFPDEHDLAASLASGLLVQAGFYSGQGLDDRAEVLLAQVIELLEPYVGTLEGEEWLEQGNHLVNALWGRTRSLIALDRPDEARVPLERGLAWLAELRRAYPASVVSWTLATRLRNLVAVLDLRAGRVTEALEGWRENEADLVDLNETFPGVVNHEDMLLTGQINLANVLTREGLGDEALDYLYAALEFCDSLAEQRPAVGEYAIRRAMVQGGLAGAHVALGELDQGEQHLAEGMHAMRTARERFPQRSDLIDFLVAMHETEADLALARGDHARAAASCEEALATLPGLDANEVTDLVERLGRCVTTARDAGAADDHCSLFLSTLVRAHGAGASLDDLLERTPHGALAGHGPYDAWLRAAREEAP